MGPVRLPALNQRSSFFTMRYLGRWQVHLVLQTVRKRHDIPNLFKPSNTFETAVSGNSIMQPLPWSILNVELKLTTLQITDCRFTLACCGIANPDSSGFQDSPGSGSVCPSIPWSACHQPKAEVLQRHTRFSFISIQW